MNFIITNDDGIESKALHILAMEMEKKNNIVVIAPDNQRSACGHSITLDKPLIVKEVKIDGLKSKAYSVNGTPADCVKIGVEKLADFKPDGVLSGINNGLNLGTDVIYSGTVSAAIEGSIYDLFSIAISMEGTNDLEDYEKAVKYVGGITDIAYSNVLDEKIVLNINVPDPSKEIKGMKICQLGNRLYKNVYVEKELDGSEIGYKLESQLIDNDEEATDVKYFKEGYITITPLHYDLTNYKILKGIEKIFK